MGSIGNAIIYIINEGWEIRELSFVSNQDENPINQSFNSNNNNLSIVIYAYKHIQVYRTY